jgi:exonuclease III
MNFLSWNVQGAIPKFGHKERIKFQIKYIEEVAGCPDLIALNEVNRYQDELLLKGLSDIGYSEIEHTLDWAEELGESNIPPHHDFDKVNGNLTAVHDSFRGENLTRKHPSIRDDPWGDSDLKHWDTNFPEKILHTELDIGGMMLDIWNIRTVPGSMYGEEKAKIMETSFNRIKKGSASPCILCGDFNSPQKESKDGTVLPWRHDEDGSLAERWVKAEWNLLRGWKGADMVDIFRTLHGYGDLNMLDVSHATKTDDPLRVPPNQVEGLRFDHIIASKELNPQECGYDQSGFFYSDHAPLLVQFSF